MGWTCSVCGEHHDDALRDIRAGLPDPVFALDDEELPLRVELTDDFCIYAETPHTLRYFVRGLLHLPINGGGDSSDFRYGVWVEVEGSDYGALGERWRDELGYESAPVFGRLANELTLYPGSGGLDVALQLREVDILPAVIVLDAGHALGRQQRAGIDDAQANRLAETVLH